MNVFDLYAKISLDTSQYKAGLEDAKKSTGGLGSAIKSGFGSAVKVAGAALTAASTAVVGFGTAAVNAGATFDSSMSQVAATMGKTVDEIGELRDFAQEMGSTTAFSASQAADALNYMALAGYDAETSMSMLPNVLNLAAAGGIELATASDMVTDAQSALGLSLDETSEMVDKMAAASSKSNTSVAQLGEAFLTIGATARNLAGGTTELSTVLGVLADNGIKGAEGGTHLRNAILSLQTPTKAGTEALAALGMTYDDMYDSAGNMRALPEIFMEMQSKMEGMNQASKDAIVSGLFNKADLASINALLGTSADRWDELSAAIDDSAGAAQKMADTQLDNLQGDVTLFKSALEGAQIAISDKLTPSLREFVQFGAEGLSQLTSAFTEGGLDAAMEKFGDILTNGITTVIEKSPKIIKAGTKLLTTLIKGFLKNKNKLRDAAHEIMNVILETLGEEFPSLKRYFDGIKDIIDGVFGFIEDNGPLIQGVLKGILMGFLAFKAVTGIMTGISTAIGLVSTAQAVLNGEMALAAVVNPYTAIAVGIAAVTAAVVTLAEKERAEFEQHLEQIAHISEADKERIENARLFSDQLADVYKGNQEVKQSVDDQYSSELALRDELAKIVDANGNIKKGYEERADVIMTQLNDAFDIELEKQGNVITNYDTEMAKIDQIIEKKKAEALLDAGKAKYSEYLTTQVDLLEDMSHWQEQSTAASEEYQAVLDKVAIAAGAFANESSKVKQIGLLEEWNNQQREADALKNKLDEVNNGLAESEKAYYGAQDYINDYNTLLEATTTGTGNLSDAIKNMTDGLISGDAPAAVLQKQAEDATNELDRLLKAYGKGAAITEEQLAEVTQKAWDAIQEWQNAGGEAVEGYAIKLAESDNVITNARALADDALKALREAQDSHSPSREFGKEGKNAVDGYAKGIADTFPNALLVILNGLGEVRKAFGELGEEAITWGTDMMANFIGGINLMIPDLTSAVMGAASVVNKNLGFSEPEEGPLSDFHTYAPDMMKLFAEGIDDNADIVRDAIEKNFDFSDAIVSPDVDYQQVYQSNTEGALNQMVALLQELVDGGMDVSLEGDAREIFRVVEKQNRQRTKATGYNSLAMAGTGG